MPLQQDSSQDCFAVPVRNEAREVVAAVDVAVLAPPMTREYMLAELGPHLVAVADELSTRLGCRHDKNEPW
jgi:DNA-binding IclR family transcriptional regulator